VLCPTPSPSDIRPTTPRAATQTSPPRRWRSSSPARSMIALENSAETSCDRPTARSTSEHPRGDCGRSHSNDPAQPKSLSQCSARIAHWLSVIFDRARYDNRRSRSPRFPAGRAGHGAAGMARSRQIITRLLLRRHIHALARIVAVHLHAATLHHRHTAAAGTHHGCLLDPRPGSIAPAGRTTCCRSGWRPSCPCRRTSRKLETSSVLARAR
jgi:hypothetical protein